MHQKPWFIFVKAGFPPLLWYFFWSVVFLHFLFISPPVIHPLHVTISPSFFLSQVFLLRTWICRLFLPSFCTNASYQMDFEVFPLICSWHWVYSSVLSLSNIKNGKMIWICHCDLAATSPCTLAPEDPNKIHFQASTSNSFPMHATSRLLFFFAESFKSHTVYTAMSYINDCCFSLPPCIQPHLLLIDGINY